MVVTYGDDQQGYPHPDHLRVHDITIPAFDQAGDPNAFPDLGEPWQPSKLYYTMWSRARILATHEKFLELGLESPFGEDWFKRPSQEERITTSVPLDGAYADVRSDALLAHATQVDPTSPFWFGLPREVIARDPPLRRLPAGPQPGRLRHPRVGPVRRPALTPKRPPAIGAVSRSEPVEYTDFRARGRRVG